MYPVVFAAAAVMINTAQFFAVYFGTWKIFNSVDREFISNMANKTKWAEQLFKQHYVVINNIKKI